MQSALLRSFGQKGQLVSWKAEDVPDAMEATNIDATWVLADGTRTICEVKLSEQDFGIAEATDRHLVKLESTYRPVLRGKVDDSLLEPAVFFESYQILRNIWHVVQGESDRLIFLFPRANNRLAPLVTSVHGKLAESIKSRVSCVYLEDVIATLIADDDCPDAGREYAKELQSKYIPTQR